jgi:hypothetical protein
MGSHQVKKQVKGKSTPKLQHHQDDADEYDEDGFEDANNHEENEPTPVKTNNSKKVQQRQRESYDND